MDPLWESHGRRLSEAGLRRGSDTSVVLTEDTDSFIIGDRVWVGGTKPGSIAYIGETQFAPGDWAGVVLDDLIGKNDGSVAGSRYFQCEPKRGIFSRLTRLTRQPIAEGSLMSPNGEKTPTSPLDNSRGSLNKSMSPSLNASTTSLASVSSKDIKLGDRVIVSSSQGSKTGVLRFIGATEFAAGEWCGVELDEAVGKNDGSVGEIRYFECRPKHGLFAPLHKVSRSPLSRRTSTMCSIHKPTGASMNSSMRRMGGSRESLASTSSIASTNASFATRGTATGSRKPGLYTSTPARTSMQEMLKEKQHEIEMLRKERDFERQRISRAATQAENAEQTVITLKQEYDKYREDMDKTMQEAQAAMAKLLEEKNALKAHLDVERQKSEDLLFRFEEESVNKDDIQNQSTDECVINSLNESKIKDLENQLSEERERVIQLEQESTKIFEAEEEITKLRSELAATSAHEQKIQEIQNRNLCLEEAKITLEKQMLERNDLIEQYAAQIQSFESQLKKHVEEAAARKDLESNLLKNSDEIKEDLVEKSAVIETMKKEHEIDSEALKKEIQQLKDIIDNITKESIKEKDTLVEEHRKIVEDKENTIELRTKELESETKRHTEMHKTALEKLRADNAEQINRLSENFNKQLADKDLQISSIVKQLEEKSAEIARLVEELAKQSRLCVNKDEELANLVKRVEELGEQLRMSEQSNGELKKQIEDLRVQSQESYSSFAQEKQKLEESMASLLASSSGSSAHLDQLTEHLKIKEKELSELRDANAAEIEELKKSFRSQIEDKTKYITEMSAEMSLNIMRLSALEKEIDELKNVIAIKDEEIKNLSENTSELRDAFTLSEETKTNLESELRMYDVTIAGLNEKISRADDKVTQLKEEKSKLEAEIANVISTSADSSDQLIKYNEDLRAKEKELDVLRDSSIELKNSLATAESKIANSLDELNIKSQLINELRSDNAKLASNLTSEIKIKDALSLEINELKTSKEQLLAKTSNDKEELEESIKLKVSELSTLSKKLEKSEQEALELNDKYTSLQNETLEKQKCLESTIKDLENQLSSIRSTCETEQKSNEILRAQLEKAEKVQELLKQNHNTQSQECEELKSLISDRTSEIQRLESNVAQVKKERDEANAALQASNAKYNESLTQLALLNSQHANNESGIFLELSNLKEQLARAELNSQEQAARLKNTEKELKDSESEKSKLLLNIKESENRIKMGEELIENNQKKFNTELEDAKKNLSVFKERVTIVEADLTEKKNYVKTVDEQFEIIKEELSKKQIELEKMKERDESFRLLEEKQPKIDELDKVNNDLRIANDTMKKTLRTQQEKIETLSNALLIEEQNSLENKKIVGKLNHELELSKNYHENQKKNQMLENYPINNKIQMAGGDMNRNSDGDNELKKLEDEMKTYKGQIDFLNSVIVDMQRKNETLACKIEVLEMGVPANEADDYSRSTLDKRTAAPRMFCDICDQFDLHETEDCPRQAQDFEDLPKPVKSKKPSVERPYCANCEMFGHDTSNCDDAETF